MAPSTYHSQLLRFQIGPVQDFIAQARSTRDLWSGSFLLSWLAEVGIRKLNEQTSVEMIYPARQKKGALSQESTAKEMLTPNLPNILVARVPGEKADEIARSVAQAISAEWQKIAKSVWDERAPLHVPDGAKDRFDAQVARHLTIAWLVTPETGKDAAAYAHDYRLNGWHMDAVRQTRDFHAWHTGGWQTTGCEKDSLSGREEAIVGGEAWQKKVAKEYQHLFKHPDHLGAVNLIKRCWHRTYLKHQPGFGTALCSFKIRSTRAIASRSEEDDDNDNVELATGEKYLAAIAFDGDSIGAWSSGEFLKSDADLRTHHERFSDALSQFALQRVRRIVEVAHKGFLVYAGGDDVLALVPADAALSCAKALRNAFLDATQGIHGQDRENRPIRPDASSGIAIAHFKSPLQDLIRAARDAERRAKNTLGRAAFSATLIKRSGEIEKWGANWESQGLELHEDIASALSQRRLSGRFPHRVCELLEPYLNSRSGIRTREDAPDFKAPEVILREFAHALDRQSQGTGAAALLDVLSSYLTALGDDPQICLQAVIGLCKSVAFTHRNRATSDRADRHHAS